MRQGQASRDGRAGGKVEPKPRAVNPAGVSQIGGNYGNHVTEETGKFNNAVENIYAGRGYTAPMRSQKTSRNGSQGRY